MKGMGAVDNAAVAKHAANLDAGLAVYNLILAKQAYLTGDELTLADLSHVPDRTKVRDLGIKDLFEK
jgi:glutathione S-transferase